MSATRNASFPACGPAAWAATEQPVYEGGGEADAVESESPVYDFTAGSLPSGATLERASTGTYFNSSGVLSSAAIDAARFDYTYNGSVWSLAGLLVEPQETNLITQSANLSGYSANLASVSADAVASPDGGTNADNMVATGGAGNHSLSTSTNSLGNGQKAVLSAFAKAGSGIATLDINAFFGFGATTRITFATGEASLIDGSVDSYGAQDVGGGWFRFWMLKTANNSFCTPGVNWNGTGTGAETVSVWGVSLTNAVSVYSYIPTSGGTVARSADVLTIDLEDGDWNLSVVTPNGTFTTGSPITVSGGNGYEFDWADLTGATTERHIQSITAEAA